MTTAWISASSKPLTWIASVRAMDMLLVELAVGREIAEPGDAVRRSRVAAVGEGGKNLLGGTLGQLHRHALEYVGHAHKGVGREVFDGVVTVADHGGAGDTRLPGADGVGVVTQGGDVVEDP